MVSDGWADVGLGRSEAANFRAVAAVRQRHGAAGLVDLVIDQGLFGLGQIRRSGPRQLAAVVASGEVQ